MVFFPFPKTPPPTFLISIFLIWIKSCKLLSLLRRLLVSIKVFNLSVFVDHLCLLCGCTIVNPINFYPCSGDWWTLKFSVCQCLFRGNFLFCHLCFFSAIALLHTLTTLYYWQCTWSNKFIQIYFKILTRFKIENIPLPGTKITVLTDRLCPSDLLFRCF